MSDRLVLLGGDVTYYTRSENNRQQLKWTGSATGTRTWNQLYSAVQSGITASSYTDDKNPMRADTPTIYRLINQCFIDDDSAEHFTGGSLYTDKWIDGTTEHILLIGYTQTTEFNTADIGRTIVGGTTGDTGTILDFNTARQLVWIRPTDPTSGGDEFDNGTEAYSIQNDAVSTCYAYDGATYNDETTDINDADASDVSVFLDVNDATYYGFGQEFSKIRVNVGTAATSGALTWEYWNGSSWTALSGVSDGTSSYNTAGTNDVTFTVPTDWAETTVSTSASLFWVRARVSTTLTGSPALTQAWIGGVGAGSFSAHARHGTGSVAGECAWAGVTSDIIGVTPKDGHVYFYQEDPDSAEGSFSEVNVVATKGSTDWWGNGNIDIALKTKEMGSIFGKNPTSPTQAYLTCKIQQYANKYGSRTLGNISTAGGNHAIAVSVDDDVDNTTGYRQMVLTDASAGFTVDEIIRDDSDSTIEGVVLSSTGTAPNITIQYYLYGDPLTDFSSGTGGFTGLTSGSTATAVNPTNVGPAADTGITMTSGAHTLDINNGNGARPYSVQVNPNNLVLGRSYERMKYLTSRGQTSDIDSSASHSAVGEAYVGNELQIEYNTQTGNFGEGLRVTGGTSGATGIIVADHDDGATGDLILRDVRGTFQASETITDTATGSATIGSLRTITPVASSPLGVKAGTIIFFAPGVSVLTANLAGGDSQNYRLVDDDGVPQTPPNSVSISFDNLVSGDQVAIYRQTGQGQPIDRTRYTLAAGNSQGNTSIVVNETIDGDNGTNANSKVIAKSASGQEHRYRYASYASSTFTLSAASTGTDGGTGTTTTIVDGTATFQTDGVEPGDMVRNTTDSKYSYVESVDSQTQLTVTNNGTTWASKAYSVNTLVESYPTNNGVYSPLIDRTSDATSESQTFILGSNFYVTAVARQGGVITEYRQEDILVDGNKTITAIRNPDDIAT